MSRNELCGRLVWFSLAGIDVRHDTLAAAVADLGLPARLVPRQATAVEAFRKACREAKASYLLANGLHAEVRIKGLGSVGGRLHRQLIRTISPPRGGNVYSDVVGEALFVFAAKETTTRRRAKTGEKLQLRLDTDRLADYERPELERLVDRFRWRYQFGQEHVSGSAARDMVRSLLEEAHALRCSPGGMYFLPAAGVPALRRVEQLCARLDILLRSLPVHNAPEVRTTLAATLHEQATHQAELLAESLAADIAKHGKLLPSTRDRFGARAELLVATLDTHAGLLEVELPEPVADTLAPVLERLAATE